jgi:hypothetical protein
VLIARSRPFLLNFQVTSTHSICEFADIKTSEIPDLFPKAAFSDPIRQCCVIIYLMFEQSDFSVVVKNRAPPPKSWRWEIYRAGRTSPIGHSEIFFGSMTEANRAGKAALRLLLSDYPDLS